MLRDQDFQKTGNLNFTALLSCLSNFSNFMTANKKRRAVGKYEAWILKKESVRVALLRSRECTFEGVDDRAILFGAIVFKYEYGKVVLSGNCLLKCRENYYKGEVREGMMQGEGELVFFLPMGRVRMKGNFENRLVGKAMMEVPNAYYLSDQWNGERFSVGQICYKKGGYYEGQIGYDNKDFEFWNHPQGKGKMYTPYGAIVESEAFFKAKEEGKCIFTDPSGHKMELIVSNEDVLTPAEIFRHKLNPSILGCYEKNMCTRAFTRQVFYPQISLFCETCSRSFCVTCSEICHKGHKLNQKPTCRKEFFCECVKTGNCSCFSLNQPYEKQFDNYVTPSTVYHEIVSEEFKKIQTFPK